MGKGSHVPNERLESSSIDARGEYSGRGTWFNVGLGNCGKMNKPSDLIVALATKTYADGVHCDQNVLITDKKSKKTVTASVRDSCPGCAPGDLDMSTGLFERFADLSVGVLDITWDFE